MSDPAPKPDLSPESNGDEEIQPFVITMPDDPSSGGDWYLWAAVLALIALVAFWPAINGTFIWDDEQYVTQNRALQSPQGLVEIWKIPPGTIQYYPLTFTALWIEHQIWGNNSLGYRVVNLLLHAGAAIVLWRILRRLKIPGAWAPLSAGTAIFSCPPDFSRRSASSRKSAISRIPVVTTCSFFVPSAKPRGSPPALTQVCFIAFIPKPKVHALPGYGGHSANCCRFTMKESTRSQKSTRSPANLPPMEQFLAAWNSNYTAKNTPTRAFSPGAPMPAGSIVIFPALPVTASNWSVTSLNCSGWSGKNG